MSDYTAVIGLAIAGATFLGNKLITIWQSGESHGSKSAIINASITSLEKQVSDIKHILEKFDSEVEALQRESQGLGSIRHSAGTFETRLENFTGKIATLETAMHAMRMEIDYMKARFPSIPRMVAQSSEISKERYIAKEIKETMPRPAIEEMRTDRFGTPITHNDHRSEKKK